MEHGQQKIAVVDFGGQYAHLIASRLRRLGAYSEIVAPDIDPDRLRSQYRGLVLSGGPASVYADGAPSSRPDIWQAGLPTLGICYGHQLLMHQAGGDVRESSNREYGPASLTVNRPEGLFKSETGDKTPTVWMSHGDEVHQLPDGFVILASTPDCRFAAVGDLERNLYGLQFHPEVRETDRGDAYLRNFIRLCGLENTWKLDDFLAIETRRIQEQVGDRKVFFLVSGGVDSTVAFAMLSRSMPNDHLRGLFVDTGFMRHEEGKQVKEALARIGVDLHVRDASDLYFDELRGVTDPEKKRAIIGELFVRAQALESESLGLNADEWFLGQGTIYPDTIESGATQHSHKIKTHHNRVPEIEELLKRGRVVEPLRELYKDEVRRLGRLLGLPEVLVGRHPFPGPALAVRMLCLDSAPDIPAEYAPPDQKLSDELEEEGLKPIVLPIRSVGVQGDQRSYAHCVGLFSIENAPARLHEGLTQLAARIVNRDSEINRVILCAGALRPVIRRVHARAPTTLTRERVTVLREADRVVTEFLMEKNIYDSIWQFPVVLVPLQLDAGTEQESIVLRPINSTDAMTASVYLMQSGLLLELTNRILGIRGIDMVFIDLTSKPPGTIEWE